MQAGYSILHKTKEGIKVKKLTSQLRESPEKLQGISGRNKKSIISKCLRTATVLASICLMLGATACAAVNHVWKPAEKADTGGNWIITPVEEDNHMRERENAVTDTDAYYKDSAIELEVLDAQTAYTAVNRMWKPVEKADTGGSWVITPVDADYYERERENGITGTEFYFKNLDIELQVIDEETAQALRELLEGNIFTENGEPFDLLMPVQGGYLADDKGQDLYSADGMEIGGIEYHTIGREKPHNIWLKSVEQMEELYAYNDSYEDAAALLGRDFRFPTIYTEGFDQPAYRLNETIISEPYFERYAVYVRLEGEPGMSFYVEKNRSGEWEPQMLPVAGGVITEAVIAETIVYKISDDYGNRYTWENEGLSYMLFQAPDRPAQFTDEQSEEIIRSMIK